jgi:hypothetical protein
VAIQPIHQPMYRRNMFGLKAPLFGGPERPLLKETASQTYTAGDLLYIDSNGTVAICTTSSDALNVTVLGQATKAATGVTGATVRFRAIIPGDIYLMNAFHTTSASAVAAQATFANPTCRKGIWMKAGAYSTTAAPLTTNTGTGSQWAIDFVTAGEGTTTAQAYGVIIGCPDRAPDGTLNALTDVHTNLEFMFMNYSFSTDAGSDPVQKRCLHYAG